MSTLNVQKVTLKKELDFGNVYVVMGTIDGELETVEITTKSQNAPKIGDTIEGTVEDTQYGKRFKKTPSAGGYRSGGRSPEEQDAIMRQHAVTDSLSLMSIIGDKKLATKENALKLAEYFLIYYKTGKAPVTHNPESESVIDTISEPSEEEIPF